VYRTVFAGFLEIALHILGQRHPLVDSMMMMVVIMMKIVMMVVMMIKLIILMIIIIMMVRMEMIMMMIVIMAVYISGQRHLSAAPGHYCCNWEVIDKQNLSHANSNGRIW
jgi:hypothetical protein